MKKKSAKPIIKPPSKKILEEKLFEGDADFVKSAIIKFLYSGKMPGDIIVNDENAEYLLLVSVAHKDLGEFDEAIIISGKLIKHFGSTNIRSAESYLVRCISYRHKSMYNKAIIDYLEAIKIYGNNKEKIALCEFTLALIYYDLNYYDEASERIANAEKLYMEVKAECEKENNNDSLRLKIAIAGLISCKHICAIIRLDDKNKDGKLTELEDVLTELKKSEKTYNLKKERLKAYILLDLARYYIKSNSGDLDKAKIHLDESLKIRESFNDKKGIAGCYLQLGEYEWKYAKLESALKNFSESDKIAAVCELLEIRIQALKGIFKCNDTLGRLGEAITAMKSMETLVQRLQEQKIENHVHLERLLPLDQKFKNIQTEKEELEIQLNNANEVFNLTAEAINRLVIANKEELLIKKHASADLQLINDFKKAKEKLNSDKPEERQPALHSCLFIMNKLIEGKTRIDADLWTIDPDYLNILYEGLKKEGFISRESLTHFRDKFIHPNSSLNSKIIWQGTLHELAYLFYYMHSKSFFQYKQKFDQYQGKSSKVICERFKLEKKLIKNENLNQIFSSNGLALVGGKSFKKKNKDDKETDKKEKLPTKAPVIEKIVNAIADKLKPDS